MVRTKFVCDHVVRQCLPPSETETRTVVLKLVHGKGEIHLNMTPEQADEFVLNVAYTVDFTRAS